MLFLKPGKSNFLYFLETPALVQYLQGYTPKYSLSSQALDLSSEFIDSGLISHFLIIYLDEKMVAPILKSEIGFLVLVLGMQEHEQVISSHILSAIASEIGLRLTDFAEFQDEAEQSGPCCRES